MRLNLKEYAKKRNEKKGQIIRILKDNEKTWLLTSEIAAIIGANHQYVLSILYRLEEEKIIERKWYGAWVWRLIKDAKR